LSLSTNLCTFLKNGNSFELGFSVAYPQKTDLSTILALWISFCLQNNHFSVENFVDKVAVIHNSSNFCTFALFLSTGKIHIVDKMWINMGVIHIRLWKTNFLSTCFSIVYK